MNPPLPPFLLSADWHFSGERPRCRLDPDWLATQRATLHWLVETALAKDNTSLDLPLVGLGDLCNTPRIATQVLVMMLQELAPVQNTLRLVAGNHDLPYHNYDNRFECSFGVLAECFLELHKHPFGELINAAPFGLDRPDDPSPYVFTHQLVFPSKEAQPVAGVGKTAEELVAMFPHAEWIFTGDYHHSFDVSILRDDGSRCRVVNPGCLLRQAADMKDYQPVIAKVDVLQDAVEWIPVPDPGEIGGEPMVTDSYLREAEERSEKVDAFLAAIKTNGMVSLSFRENLQKALDDPKLDPEVRTEIQAILDQLNTEK